MEVPFHLHPLELSRHFAVFFNNFVIDFDLRFPEGRARRLLELSLEGSEQIRSESSWIEEFGTSQDHLSFLDWPVLFEWNERWQQSRIRTLIHHALNDSQIRETAATSKLVRIILQRLADIGVKIRSQPLGDHPALVELVLFRWSFSPLRDEAEYLIERLRKTSS